MNSSFVKFINEENGLYLGNFRCCPSHWCDVSAINQSSKWMLWSISHKKEKIWTMLWKIFLSCWCSHNFETKCNLMSITSWNTYSVGCVPDNQKTIQHWATYYHHVCWIFYLYISSIRNKNCYTLSCIYIKFIILKWL